MSREISPFRRVILGAIAEEELLETFGMNKVGENRWPLTEAFEQLNGRDAGHVYPLWGKSSFPAYFNAIRCFSILNKGRRIELERDTEFFAKFNKFLKEEWFAGSTDPIVSQYLNSAALVFDGAIFDRTPLQNIDLMIEATGAMFEAPKFRGTRFLPGSKIVGSTLLTPDFRGADMRDLDLSGSAVVDGPRFSLATRLSWEALSKAANRIELQGIVLDMVEREFKLNSAERNIRHPKQLPIGNFHMSFAAPRSSIVSFCVTAGIPWSTVAARIPAFPSYMI